MKITIFTPTYNRAYVLYNLYNSLINQTDKSFIWLIVDDGSTDNTEELVASWMKENLIKIQYFKQVNQGKSMAHNKGVELTKTELFTCVDSDDYLSSDAIEMILEQWKQVNQNSVIIGMLFFKGKPGGESITTISSKEKIMTLYEAYDKYGLQGDTMLIYKSKIISKYMFPHFKGEKFVPEAYLYDLLDQEGNLYIVPEILYYCEYLEDGYTQNMSKLILNNPNGYLAWITQRLKFDTKLIQKMKNTIRYTALSIASKEENYIRKSIYPLITLFTWPLAWIFYKNRYKN